MDTNIIKTIHLAILILGLIAFGIGIHNMDLGQNLRWINEAYDLNLHDTINGEVADSQRIYSVGMIMAIASVPVIALSAYHLGRDDK